MPTYGYECQSCKEQFETVQRITEDPLKIHDGCGGALRRLLYPVGIVFKGPGFYVNDYAKTSTKPAAENGAAKSDGPEKSDSAKAAASDSTESTPAGKSEKAVDTKPAPAPAASPKASD